MYFSSLGIAYDSLTTFQRNALLAPPHGLVIFNDTLSVLQINLGTTTVPSWSTIGGGGVDTNSWDMTGVAFVDPVNGSAAGVVGDGNKPFQTTLQAFNASQYVWLLPGTYFGITQIPNGTSYMHAPTGVIFGANSRITDTASTGKVFTMTGNAIFDSFSYGIYNSSDAVMNIEFDRMNNVRTFLFNTVSGTVNISCNSALVNCFNGGGYGITTRGTSKTYVNVKHFYHSQHLINSMFQMAPGSEFIMNCPDIKIIPNYTSNYRTAAKSMYITHFCTGGIAVINGRHENTDPTTTANSAIVENNNMNSAVTIHMTINGDMIGGTGRCFRPWYFGQFGDYVFNGNMTSQSSPIYSQLTGTLGPTANINVRVKNSRISGLANVIGRGRKFYFENCTVEHVSGGPLFAGDPNGSVPAEIYTYNCSMESGGASETFSNMPAGTIVGTVNTNSTEVLGATVVDSFVPTGFTQVTGLVIPKF